MNVAEWNRNRISLSILNSLYYATWLRLCCWSVEEQIEFRCLFVNLSYFGDQFSSTQCPLSGINSVRSSEICECKCNFNLLLVVLSYTVFCLHVGLRRGMVVAVFSDWPFLWNGIKTECASSRCVVLHVAR